METVYNTEESAAFFFETSNERCMCEKGERQKICDSYLESVEFFRPYEKVFHAFQDQMTLQHKIGEANHIRPIDAFTSLSGSRITEFTTGKAEFRSAAEVAKYAEWLLKDVVPAFRVDKVDKEIMRSVPKKFEEQYKLLEDANLLLKESDLIVIDASTDEYERYRIVTYLKFIDADGIKRENLFGSTRIDESKKSAVHNSLRWLNIQLCKFMLDGKLDFPNPEFNWENKEECAKLSRIYIKVTSEGLLASLDVDLSQITKERIGSLRSSAGVRFRAKKPKEPINGLPENMVLIQQTCGVRVFNNEGRFSELMVGFHIQSPIVGFVTKKFWEQIDIFQKLKIDDHIIQKVILIDEEEPSVEDYAEYPDLEEWDEIREGNSLFNSPVCEFNILNGVGQDGKIDYRRAHSLIGASDWKLIDRSKH